MFHWMCSILPTSVVCAIQKLHPAPYLTYVLDIPISYSYQIQMQKCTYVFIVSDHSSVVDLYKSKVVLLQNSILQFGIIIYQTIFTILTPQQQSQNASQPRLTNCIIILGAFWKLNYSGDCPSLIETALTGAVVLTACSAPFKKFLKEYKLNQEHSTILHCG